MKGSVLEELKKIELSVIQLNGGAQHVGFGLQNIDCIRRWIEHFSSRRSSLSDLDQSILDALRHASAEEVNIASRTQELRDSIADLPSSKRFPVEASGQQTLELFQRHFINSLADGRLDRAFFRTKYTLGTGQPSVGVGDQVWFLHGALAPVILRPLANGNYQFMGEAYVHGVMYGEVGKEYNTHQSIAIE